MFIARLQRTASHANNGRVRDGSRERGVYNRTFIKPVLSAGTLEHLAAETQGDIEKYDILSGLCGCRGPSGEALGSRHPSRSEYLLVLAYLTILLIPQTHFVLHIFLLFCHDNKRVQQ